MDKFRIGKVHISSTNQKDAQEKITHAATNGDGGYICVSNMRMVRYADSHPDYAYLMEQSFMNLPDGTPLTWCGHQWGLNEVSKTCGPDLFVAMLTNGNSKLKHYLLGDTQDVIDAIIKKYKDVHNANIVGGESLPFAKVDEFDYKGIAERIKASGANIVWTAMRAPKQDEFDQRLYAILPNVVCIGVGRAFRISIGEVKNAPSWAVKMGLGGLFMLRGGFFEELFWYIGSMISLIGYICQIRYRRLIGKKYYE